MGVVKTNIYKGDCLYVLNDFPDNSFDLIFYINKVRFNYSRR